MPSLPTVSEIAALPRWAIVAYGARCARRALEIYPRDFPESVAIARAVDLTGSAARAGGPGGGAMDAEVVSGAIAASAQAAKVRSIDADGDLATALANAASSAVSAASACATLEGAQPDATMSRIGATSASCAAVSSSYAATAAAGLLGSAGCASGAARSDFAALLEAAEREGWTDESPVDPDSLGPIWPDGEPDGWANRVARINKLTVDDLVF